MTNGRRAAAGWMAWMVAMACGVNADEAVARKTETLSRHETVAEFLGAREHRCMGLTSLCPDQCGHSGTMASFRIVRYVKYEKPGEYGDPPCEQFDFMLVNNLKQPKADQAIRDTVAALKKGDGVLLFWNHDYVTANGVSAPERPVVRLEKLAPTGTQAWMEQVERVAKVRDEEGDGPAIGSVDWMRAVSRELGVFDGEGHGPDYGSDEWKAALHHKTFGLASAPATPGR